MDENAQEKPESGELRPTYAREVFADRGRLLPILCAFLLILPIALLGSAYAPQEDESLGLWLGDPGDMGSPVGAMVDIEDIWAIEDERTESETPLVTAMFNRSGLLGYDAGSATFYCTLGMDTGIDWPELALTAKGTDGVQVVWIDDYSYDWCEDAIAGGYRYELLAYTQEEYSYIGVVFTGLPIVTLRAGEEIGWDDVAGQVHISGEGYDAVHAMAQIRQRGGRGRRGIAKKSYRIEFRTRASTGHEGKQSLPVLGMEADTAWYLISNDIDTTCVRNEFAWSLWHDWVGEEGPTLLESRMVEVFVDDGYAGIYQLMQRIDAQRELIRMGGNPHTDVVARKIYMLNEGDKPIMQLEAAADRGVEFRYIPQEMPVEQAFDVIRAYVNLEGLDSAVSYDEDTFAALARDHLDIEEMIGYFLFLQATGLGHDNVYNNMYIWALSDAENGYRYRVSPWDMDQTYFEMTDPNNVVNPYLNCVMRVLTNDIEGSRALLYSIWGEKRETILEESSFYQRMTDLFNDLERSGAYVREGQRWGHADIEWDFKEMREYAIDHLNRFDEYIRQTWPLERRQDAK